MKKIQHCVASLFIISITTQSVNAQIKQGANMIGGSIGFSSQKTSQSYIGNEQTTKYKSISIIPSYAKAIKTNFLVGGDLGYSNSVTETNNSNSLSKTKSNGFGLGVFSRHYKNLGSSGFYLFLQNRVGVDVYKSESPISETKTNGFNIGLGLTPGIAYAINQNVHMETALNNLFAVTYYHNSSKNELSQPASTKSSGFGASIGLGNATQFTVGVKFLFGT